MDDQKEIISKRNSLCGKINDVLCFFKSVSPSIKAYLMRQYCNDLYDCVLCNLLHHSVEDVCVAWRKGIRQVWNLPNKTHTWLLAPICSFLPLGDQLMCRYGFFMLKS